MFSRSFSWSLSRNNTLGSVVLAASSSSRALWFARFGSQPWVSNRPAPRSRLVLRKNPPRHPFPPNFIVGQANDSIGSVVLAASSSSRASLFARYGPPIGPRLALASSCERIRHAIPFLPTESLAKPTIQLDRSCWLRLLPQELRCSLVTGLQSARASLSPRLAKESATPSLSSQLNRWLRCHTSGGCPRVDFGAV